MEFNSGFKGLNIQRRKIFKLARELARFPVKKTAFFVTFACRKKLLLALSCSFVRLSVRPRESARLPVDGFRRNLASEISYKNLSRKSKIYLKSDTNIGKFTRSFFKVSLLLAATQIRGKNILEQRSIFSCS